MSCNGRCYRIERSPLSEGRNRGEPRLHSQSRGGNMSEPMPCEVRRNRGLLSTFINTPSTHGFTISNITCFEEAILVLLTSKPEHPQLGDYSCTTGNRSRNPRYDIWSLSPLGYTTQRQLHLWCWHFHVLSLKRPKCLLKGSPLPLRMLRLFRAPSRRRLPPPLSSVYGIKILHKWRAAHRDWRSWMRNSQQNVSHKQVVNGRCLKADKRRHVHEHSFWSNG